MTQTISRLYDSYDTALHAALAMKDAGFTDREVSVVAHQSRTPHVAIETSAAADDAGTGATFGGAIGAAAGFMAGVGILAIPGIGPVVAAGWLASTLAVGAAGAVAGGVTGGIVGALTGSGISVEDAELYAEGVRRGDTLVTVRVPDHRVLEATRIFSGFPTVDTAAREAEDRHPVRKNQPVLPAGLPPE